MGVANTDPVTGGDDTTGDELATGSAPFGSGAESTRLSSGDEGGVVDLLTSPASFVGDDNDLLTSAFLGVADLLTPGNTGDASPFASGDGSLAGGVADLLTSESGATGSVGTYLLDSETVARGGSVVTMGGVGRGDTTAGEEVEGGRGCLVGMGNRGGGAERGVEGAWSCDSRRVAVVMAAAVGRVISLCLLRRRAGWAEIGVWSPSLSGVLRASIISSWAFATEAWVPCREGGREGGRENHTNYTHL